VTDRPSGDGLSRILERIDEREFDGHTAFADMTPAERLDVLGHMITVVADLKGLARRQDAGGDGRRDRNRS
jgi:hypothetical protein